MTHKILFSLIALSTISLYGMKKDANNTFVVEPQKMHQYGNDILDLSRSMGQTVAPYEEYLKWITSADPDQKQRHRLTYVTTLNIFLSKKNGVYQGYLSGYQDGVKIYVQHPETNTLLVNASRLLPIVQELEKPHAKMLLLENLLFSSEIDGLKQTLETLKKQFEAKSNQTP